MTTRAHARVNGRFNTFETIGFYVNDCPSCGLVWAITTDYEQRRRADGKSFYCPNGHSMGFGKSEADLERARANQLARELEMARIGRQAAQDQAEAAERSARAYRGHLTRLRNRIANGVCPVPDCQRNFANVKAHIAEKHAAWASEHQEVLA